VPFDASDTFASLLEKHRAALKEAFRPLTDGRLPASIYLHEEGQEREKTLYTLFSTIMKRIYSHTNTHTHLYLSIYLTVYLFVYY
jgi:hypothetical protein